MHQIRVSFKNVISIEKAKEVISKVYYSLQDLKGCHIDEENEEIVVVSETRDTQKYKNVIKNLISEETRSKEFRTREIFNNMNETKSDNENDQHIINYEKVRSSETGELVSSKLDHIFLSIAKRYGAEGRNYSALISRDTLHECNYVHSFPQNIMFASEFPHDSEVLNSVKNGGGYEELTTISEDALSPAVCFHSYKELKGVALSKDIILTAKESCFRHESQWRLNNYRRKEFTMREIIYIGDAGFVEKIRHSILNDVWIVFNSLNMYGKVETASDPFYFEEDKDKGLHQLFAKMKYELVISLSTNESFAISSFNNVGNSLCRSFDIKGKNGEDMHSGCVAFGLDRWAYALFVKYGEDINHWPKNVREILSI